MTDRSIAHARLRNSRLVGAPLATADQVVRWFGGVQSQDVPGAFWAIAQRMPPGTTIADVGAAFDDGAIVRTHALRPTWHFLAPDELRWIQALTGPRVRRVAGTVFRRLGLEAAQFEAAEATMGDVLAGGRALTRAQLAEAIATTGLDLSDPLVMTHLAMHAELAALICSGPRRGRQFTYQLVAERITRSVGLTPEDALRTLAIRYFTSHGPATAHDMSWWSGLTVAAVRSGIESAGDVLERRRHEGRDYVSAAGAFEPPDAIPRPFVRLLSNYDEYLGSYADDSPIRDPSLPKARNAGDVLGTHLVVRDGLVVGGWRRALGDRSGTVTATLLVPFSRADHEALEAEVERYRQFLGVPVELRVGGP